MIEYPFKEPPLVTMPEKVIRPAARCWHEAPELSRGGFQFKCRRRKGHTGRHAHFWTALLPGVVRAVWE
jgi:hypothetical protein